MGTEAPAPGEFCDVKAPILSTVSDVDLQNQGIPSFLFNPFLSLTTRR